MMHSSEVLSGFVSSKVQKLFYSFFKKYKNIHRAILLIKTGKRLEIAETEILFETPRRDSVISIILENGS